jgi:hypothetical protein
MKGLMDGTYSTHGRDDKHVQNFSQKALWKEIIGRLGIDGRIILKQFSMKEPMRV